MTQNDFLLSLFRKGKTITSLKAHREGITSLPKRICELRGLGHKIKGPKVKVKTRWGKSVLVCRYGM